jgi:DNA-binding LacI/PurR family transcriptional regulator
MSKPKKYEIVYQTLKEEISALGPGEPVKSVRELMRHCQVSQVTITRALRQLQQEGLVESSVGRGTRRAGDGARRHVVYIDSDYASTFASMSLDAFERHFNSGKYCLRHISYDHQTLSFDKSCLKAPVEAVIFNFNQDFTPAFLREILDIRLPIVFVDMLPQPLPMDAVCTDNELGGAMAADWLIRNGHSRCAFLQSLPHFHSAVTRRRAFLRQLTLAGLEGVVIDAGTLSGENSTAKAYEALKRHLGERGLSFTALFCDTDLGALGALKACHDLKIQVPGNLSIIGYDNIPEGEFFQPSLTSIDQDIGQWAVEVERILDRRLAGDASPAVQTLVSPRLVHRESTASLASRA